MGKRRLEKAISLAHQKKLPLDFRIKWHPFELDHTLTKEGMPKYERLALKFGPDRVKSMFSNMDALGKIFLISIFSLNIAR